MTDEFDYGDEVVLADELEQVVAAEAEETDAEVTGDAAKKKTLPEWAMDRKVTVYGTDFVIEPPTIGITLRIINCFGSLGVRGERAVMRALSTLAKSGGEITVSARAAMFGMLAVLNMRDVYSLGAAVLQFPDPRKGVAWLSDTPHGETLKLSPIIRALFLNIYQSDDLQDCLADFFAGLDLVGGVVEKLGGLI